MDLRGRSHDLDLLAVGSEIVEPQLGSLITDSLNSAGKGDLPVSSVRDSATQSAYRLDILDRITVLQHTFRSVLFDEFGETVRNMEFMGVGVGVLGLSQSLDGLESVLVKRLGYELALMRICVVNPPRHQARPLQQLLMSFSAELEEQQLLWQLSGQPSPSLSASS